MYLENGRDLFRGVMILLSVVIAARVDFVARLALAAFVGAITLQNTWTDWCPVDWILRPMGLKKKLESRI